MSFFWMCVCAYALIGAVAVWEAEIVPGDEDPSPLATCWAVLCYGLTYPALAAYRRLTAAS